MKSYVYTITFPSGSVYVGKSNAPERRWRHHKRDVAKGSKLAIHNALRKYPDVAVFEVVFSALDETAAFWAETLLVAEARTRGVCLNLTDGGEGVSGLTQVLSTFQKQCVSASNRRRKGEKRPERTQESRKKNAVAAKARTLSLETRAKIAAAGKAKWAERKTHKSLDDEPTLS